MLTQAPEGPDFEVHFWNKESFLAKAHGSSMVRIDPKRALFLDSGRRQYECICRVENSYFGFSSVDSHYGDVPS